MPQHAKRVRISRKTLRQPDEFQTLTSRAAEWVSANRSIAVAAGATIVLIALIAGAVSWYRASRASDAARRFREAYVAFDAKKYAEAADAFEPLVHYYGSTPFGRLAGLYRSHALLRKGDGAGAVTAYTEYLETGAGTDYLRQEALNGLGHAKETTGDSAGAIDAYTKAGDLQGPYRVDSLLAAARLRDAAGQHDQAQAIWAQLLKEAPSGDVRSLLLAKLPPGQAAPAPPPAEP